MPTTRKRAAPTTPRSSKQAAAPAVDVSSSSESESDDAVHTTNGHGSNGSAAALTNPASPSKNGVHKAKRIQHISPLWTLLAFLCMTAVVVAVYWCWICVEHNQGHMILPKSLSSADLKSWIMDDILLRIYNEAWPTWRATIVYLVWVSFQALLYMYAPGPVGEGLPCIDGPDQGVRLKYKYNGQFAWGVTLVMVAVLHFTGVFRLTELASMFGPMQTVCNLYTYLLILALYLHARWTNTLERRTDSPVYDYFMGPKLNPRIGNFDVKFFHELRPGIMHWFFTTIGFAIKQYERDGAVTMPMLLVCFYHVCFVNACYKGEQCVPMSMDIIYEKFGWMLGWLDLVCVPFVFPLQAYYLYVIPPFEHPWYITSLLLFAHCFSYYMFDTSNAQKDYFRANEKKDQHHIPYGFPNLPWSKLDNPNYLPTKRGTKLLLDGWWKYARHCNYAGDIIMSWTWGLTCGVSSYFPFAYTTYLTPLLLHRERRDNIECKRKYGEDWDKYCEAVPYRIFPYIY